MSVIGEGKFWDAFKKTDWYLSICSFVEGEISIRKDDVCRLVGEGETLKAAKLAGEINGLTALKDYVDGKILDMDLEIKEQDEEREFKKGVPSHI